MTSDYEGFPYQILFITFLSYFNSVGKLSHLSQDCFFKRNEVLAKKPPMPLNKLVHILKSAMYFYDPLGRREGILLCTCLSVCPSVTFSFPINNSRTPLLTFLKLGPHIRPGEQRNHIDFGLKCKMCQKCFRWSK